jgi:3-oxoacyl-[acyl-carrier protein] reductase
MDLHLKNKVSLVCAASEGLGKASALELAREGSRVAICSRSIEKLTSTQKEIVDATGAEVAIFETDLTVHEDIKQLQKDVKNKLGDIEILVNNAGGPPPGTFEKHTDEDWQKAINLTMMSVLRMSKLVLPSMKEKKWGRIINISSVSVKTPVNNLFLSNSIRLGVLGWAKALSDEVGKDGITVNTVCPGSTRTNRITSLFSETAKQTGQTFEQIEEMSTQNIPMKRIGEPNELAALVAFLASERASYMTGLAIQVDGGSARGYY